jgi:PleD family two-component response regulator
VSTLSNETLDHALQRADELLYKAKNAGRNKVVSQ